MKKLMLDTHTIHAIAEEVVRVLEEKKKHELVSTEEAARMLGISPRRLRQIKEKVGYVKSGENSQGRLMFDASTIRERYIRQI